MAQVKVGDEAVVAHYGSWSTNHNFGYVVTKVTPKGQVVVKRESDSYERRFDANGVEMKTSASKYRRDVVLFNVAELRNNEARMLATKRAEKAISDVGVEMPGYGNTDKKYLLTKMEELEAQMARARELIELISE